MNEPQITSMSTPRPTPKQQLWTIQRAAARWQCHELTVRRKIKRGELKVLRFSRQHVRIPFAEILRHEQEARAWTDNAITPESAGNSTHHPMTPTTPRPTPETDAVAWVVAFGYQHLNEDVDVVDAEFARQRERERDEARALNGDMLKLMRRLHLAITARMSADNPTDEQRLELRLAWEEAASFWKASCL
jgi:excisionase family DNA binding protein